MRAEIRYKSISLNFWISQFDVYALLSSTLRPNNWRCQYNDLFLCQDLQR